MNIWRRVSSLFRRVIVVKEDRISLLWYRFKILFHGRLQIQVNLNNLIPQIMKRLIDLAISFSGLIILAPIIGLPGDPGPSGLKVRPSTTRRVSGKKAKV
jgi:hypothetical protein